MHIYDTRVNKLCVFNFKNYIPYKKLFKNMIDYVAYFLFRIFNAHHQIVLLKLVVESKEDDITEESSPSVPFNILLIRRVSALSHKSTFR